jgi:hypothetical protein
MEGNGHRLIKILDVDWRKPRKPSVGTSGAPTFGEQGAVVANQLPFVTHTSANITL